MMKRNGVVFSFLIMIALGSLVATVKAAEPQVADLILHNGKIATVDDKFSIAQAIAVKDRRIIAVGTDAEVLKHKGEKTKLVDLQGKLAMPGLIDSHTHPIESAMFEYDHIVPEMLTIQDVLDYIGERAKVVKEGNWINVSQVFITRLKEQRYPTRAELDKAAPKHPVVFATGPDASLNSLAMKLSGLDKDFKETGSGFLERDPDTNEPTGILRSCTRYIKGGPTGSKSANDQQRLEQVVKLLDDYNACGITTICDRSTDSGDMGRFRAMKEAGVLTVRVTGSWHVGYGGRLEDMQKEIKKAAAHELAKPDDMVRIIGIKMFLDGGMLTGSAFMRDPWGVSTIYSIRDPKYRGVRFIEPDTLEALVQTSVDSGLQFTAHAVGDGAVHDLLAAYEKVNAKTPIRDTHPTITHSNFMSSEAVDKMVKLGVASDIQPAWLYLDTRTLVAQFGYDRLRYFQPLKTIFERGAIAGGGSDHMQKIGSLRSVNPYNPFLGMGTAVTRKARWYDGQLHPEEALNREQMIRFYTRNNAHIVRMDKSIGSLEVGKLADIVVVDRDLLTCPADEIRETKVLHTFLGGQQVYPKGK